MHDSDKNLMQFPVEFVLNVVGRGVTALCSFPDPKIVKIQAGDSIRLQRPDGSIFRTMVKGLSMVHATAPDGTGLIGLILPEETDRDEIPYGSFLQITHQE